MRRGQEPVGIMAGRGIANSGRSEGRVPGVRSRILRSTRLVSVNDAFRQQPLEGRDQTNRRRGCCGVSKGWVEPVVAAPFDDPDCRSAVVCHASRRSASPAATGLTIPAYRLHAAPDYVHRGSGAATRQGTDATARSVTGCNNGKRAQRERKVRKRHTRILTLAPPCAHSPVFLRWRATTSRFLLHTVSVGPF